MKSLWCKSMALALGLSGAAYAEDKDSWPGELVLRSVTIPQGMIEINAPLGINLSKGQVGQPVFFAPNIYYGVTSDLQVGITHLVGICFTGKSNGCPRVYDDVGVDGQYRFLRGDFDLAVHLGLPISSFDPFTLSARIGLKGRVVFPGGKLALLFDPFVQIGITERESITVGDTTIGGNKELLAIPVQVAVQASPRLAVGVGTTFGGPFDGFGDTYTGSLDLLGLYNVSQMVDVFLQFSFTNLYGKHGSEGAADGRALFLGANIWL